METLKEHVKIATEMYDKRLSRSLIKEFTMQELKECCSELEKMKVDNNLYLNENVIQREIIKDINTVKYLVKINNKGIEKDKINELIEMIQNNFQKLTDYEIEKIIEVLNIDTTKKVRYFYLRHFSNRIKSKLGKEVVIRNLEFFLQQSKTNLEDLTEQELQLFTSPILSDFNLMPQNSIRKTYKLLIENQELKKLIFFLYLKKLNIYLNIERYDKLAKDAKQIYECIYRMSKFINTEILYRLLSIWLGNGANLYELEKVESKIEKNDSITLLENIVNNKVSYINFIFDNKLSDFDLENMYQEQEEIIIYAICNNKNSFLRLIKQNQEDFFNIPINSILYNKNFYSKYININSLSIKELKELKFIKGNREYFEFLDERIYTFNEIKMLYNSSNPNAYKLYNYFLNLKVDDRILRTKQLINNGLIDFNMTEDEIKKLAEKINYKSLYKWLEQDFKNIYNIKPIDSVNLLMNYNEMNKFLTEITDRNELLYLLRNKENLSQYQSLQEIKDNIENIDMYWQELIKIMGISQEFINKNSVYVKEFLLNNGAELALEYYKSHISEKNKAAYKLIVKAELMGEFKKLKYHINDLKREIDFNLEEYQIQEWTHKNIFLNYKEKDMGNGEIEAGEYDDFYSTMILGEEPMQTCLSYKNGMYNKCLLACFDSNKKILYAKVNGKIVARAMVRLTKGEYQNVKKEQKLYFVDVENDNSDDIKIRSKERLTIFLEKAYISGISKVLELEIEKLFIAVLKKKAQSMNALLVISNYYRESIDENWVSTFYYMYISKSKAGSQYLDSLSGEATIIDEGQYKGNNFLIWKQK